MWSGLEPGPYAVGFRVTFVTDSTRTYGVSAARPVRLFVWYPGEAQTSGGPRMTFGEYLMSQTRDPRFGAYDEALTARDVDVARRQFAQPADSLLEWLMQQQTAAYREIAPAAGRFPLAVHSLGRNDFQAESTVLWEYLTSHGYVIAVVPQVGTAPDNLGVRFTLDAIEVQLQDVAVALRAMSRESLVDPVRTAVIGHSSGGLVGLLLASRDTSLDALVSLDGSISTTDGRDLLVQSRWWPARVTVPVLNLYAAGKRDLDLSVLDSLANAARYHIALGTGAAPHFATHFDFQNWPVFAVLSGIADARGAAWRSAETGRDIYVAACRLTRYFLDHVLRNDAAAARYVRGESPLPQLDARLLAFRHQTDRR